MECPNGTQEPIYDNTFNPPRLVGWTKGGHNWTYTTEDQNINGQSVRTVVKICSQCGAKQ